MVSREHIRRLAAGPVRPGDRHTRDQPEHAVIRGRRRRARLIGGLGDPAVAVIHPVRRHRAATRGGRAGDTRGRRICHRRPHRPRIIRRHAAQTGHRQVGRGLGLYRHRTKTQHLPGHQPMLRVIRRLCRRRCSRTTRRHLRLRHHAAGNRGRIEIEPVTGGEQPVRRPPVIRRVTGVIVLIAQRIHQKQPRRPQHLPRLVDRHHRVHRRQPRLVPDLLIRDQRVRLRRGHHRRQQRHRRPRHRRIRERGHRPSRIGHRRHPMIPVQPDCGLSDHPIRPRRSRHHHRRRATRRATRRAIGECRGLSIPIHDRRRRPPRTIPSRMLPRQLRAITEPIRARNQIAVTIERINPAVVIRQRERRRRRRRCLLENQILLRIILQPRRERTTRHIRPTIRRIHRQRRLRVNKRHPQRPTRPKPRPIRRRRRRPRPALIPHQRPRHPRRPRPPHRHHRHRHRKQPRPLVHRPRQPTTQTNRPRHRTRSRSTRKRARS